MPSKHSQPALYEKMSRAPDRGGSIASDDGLSAASPRRTAPSEPSAIEGLAGLLGPGRALRVPVGYLLLGGGMFILVVWFAFMLGHNRGEKKGRSSMEEAVVLASGGAGSEFTTLDPLNPPDLAPSSNGGANSDKSPGDLPAPGKWGPVAPRNNPCRKGNQHFVLAETTESGALALAEFCRSKGLETYVVSGNNARFRQVVAFPGFDQSTRHSPAVKALEQRIHQVGQQWKAKSRSNSDLRDAYPKVIVP